jgi:hypothetical protein
MNVPLPENEAERLAALHDLSILDTPPELAYDELSALAAYICQTPIAGGSVPITLKEFAALVHPDDAVARTAAWNEVASGRSPLYRAEFRMRDGKGQWVPKAFCCGESLQSPVRGTTLGRWRGSHGPRRGPARNGTRPGSLIEGRGRATC